MTRIGHGQAGIDLDSPSKQRRHERVDDRPDSSTSEFEGHLSAARQAEEPVETAPNASNEADQSDEEIELDGALLEEVLIHERHRAEPPPLIAPVHQEEPETDSEQTDDSVAASGTEGSQATRAATAALGIEMSGREAKMFRELVITESIADARAESPADVEPTTWQPTGSAAAPASGETAVRTAPAVAAAAAARVIPDEVAESWAERALHNRARVVVGSGDDRVAVLVALEKEGVRIVAEAAAAETAEFLTRNAHELERVLAMRGRGLLELIATSSADEDDERVASARLDPNSARVIA